MSIIREMEIKAISYYSKYISFITVKMKIKEKRKENKCQQRCREISTFANC